MIGLRRKIFLTRKTKNTARLILMFAPMQTMLNAKYFLQKNKMGYCKNGKANVG